ncbi:MAG TPA: SGNH/GDSL hydrolase family protein [Flavitalea sp.]|nr:SGNH/GDSL hydrolase family protein [Flavitalea sp.]
MNQVRTSKKKNIVYTLVSIFLLFLIIEIILSIFFFHKYSDEKLATIEALKLGKRLLQQKPNSINVKNQQLVRPTANEETNKGIATEIHASNKFRYTPWIEFSNIDYTGKYVNIQNGMRSTVPDHIFPSGSKDTIDIYFFGGSTMFGFNVSDEETLPSQFVRLYQQQYPTGKSIRVQNFGTPTYYSYQELMQYAQLIFKGHRPDVVVFLDGVNDFWFVRASYYNQSYFSFVPRQVFDENLLNGGKFQFRDSSQFMYRDPVGISKKAVDSMLVLNYFSNLRNMEMLAGITGATPFFFCQPVPFYKYPNQQKDPICFHDQHTRYDVIYPEIEKNQDRIKNFTFLGNMLTQEKGYPFVDGLHYSPAFTGKISQAILDKVGKEINTIKN